jgi:hypothetical protein
MTAVWAIQYGYLMLKTNSKIDSKKLLTGAGDRTDA